MTLRGHKLSVEDAKFKPLDKDILCSVGVDRKVLFWDLRTGADPVSEISNAHSSDINTVDWSSLDLNLVATGSNDTKVQVLDIRMRAVVQTLAKHKSKVQTVKFCPFSDQYLASSGDSLIIWDLKADCTEDENIILNHIGHIGQVSDFDWNADMPWSFISASDDSETFN